MHADPEGSANPEWDSLLPTHSGESLEDLPRHKRWKHKTGETLESKRAHRVIITLILIDALCVITDLSYVFLLPQCSTEEPELPFWLEVLSRISLTITTFFLLEIPIAIWAFGFGYYNPFSREYTHTGFHLFDAVVIVGSFVVEVFLKGRDKELASLIIVLRLWRIVKVVGGVAVGVSEYNEEAAKELKKSRIEIQDLHGRIKALEEENARLKTTPAYGAI